jgi:hypothetical protein
MWAWRAQRSLETDLTGSERQCYKLEQGRGEHNGEGRRRKDVVDLGSRELWRGKVT